MSFYHLTPIARRAIALLFLTIGLGFGLRAQAPLGFKFQAMARDAQDQLLANHEVAVRVNLLQGDASGAVSYSERHVVTTSDIGIFDLTIGGGDPLQGDIADIDWGSDSYFLQIDLDPDGGIDYVNMGATQLLSVPYALYANQAGGGTDEDRTDELQELIYDPSTHRLTITDGNTIDLSDLGGNKGNGGGSPFDPPSPEDNDATNEIQQVIRVGDSLYLSLGGGNIDLRDADSDPLNEIQELSLTGRELSIAGGNAVTLPGELDGDVTNEIQQLSLADNVLSLSHDGGSVTLPLQQDDADADPTNEMQDIVLVGKKLSISGGSTVALPDADAENEIQQLTLEGNILTLNRNGGSVVLPEAGDNADADADPTNEIQDISLAGRELSISAGSTVTLPEELDGDVTNELQQITHEGSIIRLSQDGGEVDLAGMVDVEDADADPTNEMQDIVLVGKELSISGGSTVALPEEVDGDVTNELQQITHEGSVIRLSQDGGEVDLAGVIDTDDADADPVNELQQISLEGNVLTLNQNGGSVVLPAAGDNADADADPNNEIQDISLAGRELSISAGSTVTLPEELDGDPTNEIQDIVLVGKELSISGGSTVALPDDADADPANELQQITLEGNVLTLNQNGGSVVLPAAGDNADADADPNNEIQDISLAGRELSISAGSTVTLPEEVDGDVTNELQQITNEGTVIRLSRDGGELDLAGVVDADPANELQQLTLEGNVLTLNQNGGSVVLPAAGENADADADPTNEIQDITLDAGALTISGGSTVELPDADAENELQELTLMGNVLTLNRNGGSVVLPAAGDNADADADPTNEIQQIQIDGRELTISGGNTISLPEDDDADAENELQELTLTGNVLTLNRNGGSVVLPAAGDNADADADPSNEIQDISLAGRELSISEGSTVVLPEEMDGDATNEIQELTLTGNVLTLNRNGGSVVLPAAGDNADADADPTNEIQDISLEGRQLTISGGSTVDLPLDDDGDAENEIQQITNEGSIVRLSHDGGEVDLQGMIDVRDADADATNEIQQLSLEGNVLRLNRNGGSIELPATGGADADADPSNEIQKFNFEGNDNPRVLLSENNANFRLHGSENVRVYRPQANLGDIYFEVEIPDNDPENEIQKFNFEGTENPRVLLSENNANFRLHGSENVRVYRPQANLGDIYFEVDIPENPDADPTNELQEFKFEGMEDPRIVLSQNLTNFRLLGGENVRIHRPQANLGDIYVDVDIPENPDADPRNELQQLSLEGDYLTLSNGGGKVQLPAIGGTQNTDNQRLSFDSDTRRLSIDGGNAVTIPGVKDSDANPSNELQTLSLSGNVLSLSNNGGSVTLPASSGSADADADPTNEFQTFNFAGGTDPRISLSGNDANFRLIGGNNATVSRKTMNGDITIDVANDGDGDSQNELQRLSISGNTLSLSGNGGSVTIPTTSTSGSADADADPNNEIQDFRFEGTINPRVLLSRNLANFKLIGGENVLISRKLGRGDITIDAIVPREADGDPTNELQQISFDEDARKIYLTDGGEIDLNPFIEEAESRLQATIDSQEALNKTLKQNVEDLQMQLANLAEQLASLKNKVDGVHPN